MYLTGFTLFLSLILTRTYYIIHDLIHTQDEYAKLKKAVSPCVAVPSRSTHFTVLGSQQQTAAQSRANIANKDQASELAALKTKITALEAQERDFGARSHCMKRSCALGS